MNKQRDYKKPMMQIVKLQHRGMLMTSTPESESKGVERQDYESTEW